MKNKNILIYESEIWRTADLLIGAGIKQSDFPKYMMPYFALIMVESRLVREAKKLSEEYGVGYPSELKKDELEDFIEEFKNYDLGYNDFVIRQNKKLIDICENDKTFEVDFDKYLKAFDVETKLLLGVDKGNDEGKFMDISGMSGFLRKKKILFATVKAWSQIDLLPFDNSEITTLEEHIKRKWADISAETAGEQYTPNDVIALISEIIISKIEDNGKFLTIYDPTCGGGNMLFGVEDKINEKYSRPIKTFGEDWNDNLYALAKIESRFREDSEIEYGNSLTGLKFSDKKFNVIVANPPYGVDWKGYKKDIEMDQTDRFVALPSVSDGQFLFTQHIISQLDNEGLAVVVHNGSTLFSGDAGSGESNIRKYFFDNDFVEAIIQLPTDEFFNTGIYTYLWVFNKNKVANRKDKIIMINASEHFAPLKKSRGKKRKEMPEEARSLIVKTLKDFKDSDFAKVFDKWHFYFNKQAIMLTNVDENGKSFESELTIKKGKSLKLSPKKIIQINDDGNKNELTNFTITDFDNKKYTDLKTYYENELKSFVTNLDYKNFDLKVITDKATYYFDNNKETIIEEVKGKKRELGCGKIIIKASFKKATKTKDAEISIVVELTPDYQKDYEIIPYLPNEKQNQKQIADFMAKYINKPFEYLDNVIGVELNFNKIFYKAEQMREVNEIVTDLTTLEQELSILEKELALRKSIINQVVTKGLNKDVKLIRTSLGFEIKENWKPYRLKDLGYLYTGLSGKSGDDFNQENNPKNRGFIPFTNIANNTYLKKDHLGTVVIENGEKQNAVKKGDIFFLMSSEGFEDIGKTAVLAEDIEETYLNSFCKGFRVNQNKCNPYFLNYLMLSDCYRQILLIEGKGFTRINLKMEKIKDFTVYIPDSLSEQEQIVNYLDTKTNLITSIITNIETQINTLKELRKTLINDVVTGKIKVV